MLPVEVALYTNVTSRKYGETRMIRLVNTEVVYFK